MTAIKHGTMQTVRAFQFITASVDNSAAKSLTDLGLSAEDIKMADHALINIEDADVRYRLDGLGVPTTTHGHPAFNHDDLNLYGYSNIVLFSIIATSGTANLTITLSKMA